MSFCKYYGNKLKNFSRFLRIRIRNNFYYEYLPVRCSGASIMTPCKCVISSMFLIPSILESHVSLLHSQFWMIMQIKTKIKVSILILFVHKLFWEKKYSLIFIWFFSINWLIIECQKFLLVWLIENSNVFLTENLRSCYFNITNILKL